jgi:uncharacterized low-complexity protein
MRIDAGIRTLSGNRMPPMRVQQSTTIQRRESMSQKTLFAAALGTAFAAGLAAAPAASAADNPFKLVGLSAGYQVADAGKSAEGKCGAARSVEGKCGAKAKSDAKAGEGKCGATKSTEGKCGAKARDDAKMKEGKCGEGACGGQKK